MRFSFRPIEPVGTSRPRALPERADDEIALPDFEFFLDHRLSTVTSRCGLPHADLRREIKMAEKTSENWDLIYQTSAFVCDVSWRNKDNSEDASQLHVFLTKVITGDQGGAESARASFYDSAARAVSSMTWQDVGDGHRLTSSPKHFCRQLCYRFGELPRCEAANSTFRKKGSIMSNTIVAKLRDHLTKPIDTECSVVYLLAQIRKVLEKQPSGSAAVTMFCHWSLHLDLDRPGTTSEFLSRVDEFVCNKVAGYPSTRSWNYLEEDKLNRDLLRLDNFRSGLRDVLKQLDLPTGLVDDEPSWKSFVEVYGAVVEGGSLTVRSQKIQLQVVEKVVFTKAIGPGPFAVKWAICFKDGRALVLEFGAAGPVSLRSYSLVSAADAGC